MLTQRFNWLPVFLTIVLSGAMLAACGDNETSGADGLTVVASTSIIAALAEEVAGDDVNVIALMGPGIDPHTFEMTPGDIRALADAELVLINGLELDNYLIEDVENANGSAEIVVVTDGIDLLVYGAGPESDHEDDEHDHEYGEFDPHVWQDPLRVKVMVTNIADAFAEVDPDNASNYQERAETYHETLEETHAEIQALIDQIPVEHRKMVTNHEAFSYFADRYDLDIIGTVIPGSSTEADPSASDIAALTKLIEEEGVRAIFAETLIDPKVAEALAEDTGITIVYDLYTDQVGEPGSGAETVHEMLLQNATAISEALR